MYTPPFGFRSVPDAATITWMCGRGVGTFAAVMALLYGCQRDLAKLSTPTAVDEVLPSISDLQVNDTREGNTLSLSWTNPTSPLYSYVRVQRDSALVFDGDANAFIDTALEDGRVYRYAVFAVSARGVSSAPVTQSGVPTDQRAPEALVTFVAENEGTGGSVRLSWTGAPLATLAEPVRLRIVRAMGADPIGVSAGVLVAELAPSVGSFVDTGLMDGTMYYYRAFVFDEVPNYSIGLAATSTPQDVRGPAEVTVVARVVEGDAPQISWELPTDIDFSYVQLLRRADSGNEDVLLDNSLATSFVDASAVLGVRYEYILNSFDTLNNVTTQSVFRTRLSAVTNITLEARENNASEPTIELTWTNPADADFIGVTILRRVGGFPLSSGDTGAELVFSGMANTASDIVSATEGKLHYYRIWALDTQGNTGAVAEAGPYLAPQSVRINSFFPIGFAYSGYNSVARVLWRTTAADVNGCTLMPGSLPITPEVSGFIDVDILQAPLTVTLSCTGWRGPVRMGADIMMAPAQLGWVVASGGNSVDSGNAVALHNTDSVFYVEDLNGKTRLAKVSYDGTPTWSTTFSGGGSSSSQRVALIPGAPATIFLGGDFRKNITLGSTLLQATSSIAWHVYVAKLQDGTNAPSMDWAVRLGGDVGQNIGNIVPGPLGSVLVSGHFVKNLWVCDSSAPDCCDPGDVACVATAATTLTTVSGDSDGFVISYSSSGAYQWHMQLSSSEPDRIADIASYPNGDFVVVGYISAEASLAGQTLSKQNNKKEAIVTRFASDGTVQWSAMGSGGPAGANVEAVSVAALKDGGVAVVGYFKGSATFGPNVGDTLTGPAGTFSSFVARYSAAGNLLWVNGARNTKTTVEGVRLWDVAEGAENTLVLTGRFMGDLEFQRDSESYSISATGGQTDIFIGELDGTGLSVWRRREGSTGIDAGRGVAVGSNGNIFVTGSFQNTVSFGSTEPSALVQERTTPTTSPDSFLLRLNRN